MTATHGFELIREHDVPEINSKARLYRHAATGAELLSLVNSDENKVFGVSFATPPTDSTGVAHILEHSVLCGSRKYPIKEPFVELMKSSLNTFLNAMTFPDKTCYPVASQNVQDFYNLIDVYLDAVFHPRLTPQIFEQEGWHYELEFPEAPLIYKGVVFNEMKGNYSSPDSMLRELSQRSLYPDITYGLDSGGDPKHIPDLTYDELKAFHQRHYHPSNAKFFFYGDDDPEERLRLLGARLKEFSPIEVKFDVPLQPRFPEPKRLTRTYAASNEDRAGAPGDEAPRETMLTVNWMLDEPADIETALAFDILEHILIGTAAAPALQGADRFRARRGARRHRARRRPAPADVLDRPQGHRRRRCRQGRAPDPRHHGDARRQGHRRRHARSGAQHRRIPSAREQHRRVSARHRVHAALAALLAARARSALAARLLRRRSPRSRRRSPPASPISRTSCAGSSSTAGIAP